MRWAFVKGRRWRGGTHVASAVIGNAMESVGKGTLLDANGRPLDSRIQAALQDLVPRFRNRFVALHDDLLAVEIFEEAGRRVSDYEAVSGLVKNLQAYAWKTVVNVARSRLRHSSMRFERAMLASDVSESVLGTLTAADGSAEQIEADILLEELLGTLTLLERKICMRKKAGFSSREIGIELGMSATHVDTLFYRIRRKFRDVQSGKGLGADMRDASEGLGRGRV